MDFWKCYLLIGVLFFPHSNCLHGDLRRELTHIKTIMANMEENLEKVNDIEQKVQSLEQNINSVSTGVEELNRKSSLLREIHQDNDGRSELLQRITKAIEEINRKQSLAVGRKLKTESEKLDKLSENVQALFQIFGGLSRKFDDFHTRVETILSSWSLSELKTVTSKKLDVLSTSAMALTECLQCRRGHTIKDVFQASIRHILDRKIELCTATDVEQSVSRILDPKLSNFIEVFQNEMNFKFKKLSTELDDLKTNCKASGDEVVGDMEYSHDRAKEHRKGKTDGDSGNPRETPGRMFRKLWRRMTEPINKVGDKIESLGYKLEASHQKQYNHTISKIMEIFPKTDSSETCSKQVQVLTDTAKDTVDKLDNIESRQVTVQTMCSKILSQLEKGKSLASTDEDGGTTVSQPSKPSGAEFFDGSVRESYQVPRSCAELQEQGMVQNNIYHIKPKNSEEFLAYCDLETSGGGWTVIQRRGDYGALQQQNFTQGWEMYKNGFGNFQRDFWLGNEKMHLLSTQDNVTLRVELEDFDGTFAFAEYSTFRVEDESHQYRLSVGGYEGNATDSLSLHDGKLFSTEDRDNDEVSSCCNCADTFKGGWWYYRCFEANLNGPYHTVPTDNGYFLGIIWERWRGDYSLKSSEMKIRPHRFELRFGGDP